MDDYILVVEDEAISRINLTIILNQAGYTMVRAVNDGAACLDEVKQRVPDLIILDLGLPAISGEEVLQMLKADEVYCEIIILTARNDKDTIVKCIKLGASGYLTKPAPTTELLSTVKAHLAKRRWRAGAPLMASAAPVIVPPPSSPVPMSAPSPTRNTAAGQKKPSVLALARDLAVTVGKLAVLCGVALALKTLNLFQNDLYVLGLLGLVAVLLFVPFKDFKISVKLGPATVAIGKDDDKGHH